MQLLPRRLAGWDDSPGLPVAPGLHLSRRSGDLPVFTAVWPLTEASMRRTGWWVAGLLVWWGPAGAHAQSVNMGTTFHELEARAERVVVTFDDAEVETRRATDGSWRASLRNAQGRLQAHLEGQRGQRGVRFRPAADAANAFAFELADATDVGLDWTAVQLYTNWVDAAENVRAGRPASPAATVWDGHVRRDPAARGRGRSVAQLAARIRKVRTTFPDVDVTATLDEHQPVRVKGKRIDYSKFTARVVDRRTGRHLGFVRWFDTAQVLTWKIEGGTSGVVMPDRLPEGWTFTPTLAWANVQAYYFATHPQHTDLGSPVVRRLRDVFTRPSDAPALGQVAWLGPLAGLSQPLPWRTSLPAWGATPAASTGTFNEPGCDNLHWLDGTVFRMCCDRHDTCYEKQGCSALSWWWPFSAHWQCARCNAQAVYCFCTLANPYHCGGSGGGGGGGGGDDTDCSRASGGFCPVTCQSCIAA